MKIPLVFQPYETLTEKDERLAHEEMEEEKEEEEEEGEEMEIEKGGEEETSLESNGYPITPNNPSNKTLLKNKRLSWKTNGFSNDSLVKSWTKFPPK